MNTTTETSYEITPTESVVLHSKSRTLGVSAMLLIGFREFIQADTREVHPLESARRLATLAVSKATLGTRG